MVSMIFIMTPTGDSIMVPGMNRKRSELGAWGRLSKRSTESSSYWGDLQTQSDPRIRIIRGGGTDLNQWERTIKRRGEDRETRMWPIKNSKVLAHTAGMIEFIIMSS